MHIYYVYMHIYYAVHTQTYILFYTLYTIVEASIVVYLNEIKKLSACEFIFSQCSIVWWFIHLPDNQQLHEVIPGGDTDPLSLRKKRHPV